MAMAMSSTLTSTNSAANSEQLHSISGLMLTARGCQAGGITRFSLLSAVGSTAKSRIRYVRVMGLKEEAVQGIGFQRLAIFRPGIIAGNAHTPRYVAWLGRLIPGRFGTIEQDDIGRAFVAEFISSSAPNGVVYLENGAMRQRSRALK